ncbi:MAG TPA: acetylornithine transaminase [Firmicutes bacterium]|nr:acetylornithine transaminase [Bacillota bacterium]
MNFAQIKAKTEQYLMSTYARFDLALVKGRGTTVWDAAGRAYLDFLSGIAVCNLGHCHPKVVEAVTEQVQTLIHCSNLYHIEQQASLAERLCTLGQLDQAFFCNSGAEANEGAIKLARRYSFDKYGPGRGDVITARDSFHGRTITTITATGQPKYQQGFAPLTPGFTYVPLNDLEALQSAITESTCAVLLEPVQGEGGVRPCDYDYLQAVATLCKERDILLILDEVQTGMGRTGKLFAYQHFDLIPDIVTLAKALGGGIPIGAVLAKKEVAKSFRPGTHASTFGGNPLACSAALAVLEVLTQQGFLDQVENKGLYFKHRLEALRSQWPNLITEVRGLGLILGVDLTFPVREAVVQLQERGILVGTAGENTLRFLPPLIVTEDEIERVVLALEDILKVRSENT